MSLYTPQRLFGEGGSSPDALTYEPFLERARVQREQDRDEPARLALGAYVVARLVDKLKAARPDVPVIGFPKGAGGKLGAYARETGIDAVGLDETVDPAWADRELPEGLPVQGNLDPLALIAGGPALEAAVERIRRALAGRPHIFNLGHGIQQTTPIAHVEALLRLLGKPL